LLIIEGSGDDNTLIWLLKRKNNWPEFHANKTIGIVVRFSPQCKSSLSVIAVRKGLAANGVDGFGFTGLGD
jgi:hypothetical protein